MFSLSQLAKYILGQSVPVIQWLVPFQGPAFQGGSAALVDGAAIAVDGATAESFVLVAASNAVRAIQAPTGLSAGAVFRVQIKNTSGGALTNTTFVAAYHGAPTLPATTFNRVYTWLWDGAVAYFVAQTPADIAN